MKSSHAYLLCGIGIGMILSSVIYKYDYKDFDSSQKQMEKAVMICQSINSTPVSFSKIGVKCENGASMGF